MRIYAELNFNEDAASKYGETNGVDTGDINTYLSNEMGWVEQSGIYLGDFIRECNESSDYHKYLLYLLQWVFDHKSDVYAGMSPACFDEWIDNEAEEEEE